MYSLYLFPQIQLSFSGFSWLSNFFHFTLHLLFSLWQPSFLIGCKFIGRLLVLVSVKGLLYGPYLVSLSIKIPSMFCLFRCWLFVYKYSSIYWENYICILKFKCCLHWIIKTQSILVHQRYTSVSKRNFLAWFKCDITLFHLQCN